nr:hypothetical protein [Tanacetum cinerariifolium]
MGSSSSSSSESDDEIKDISSDDERSMVDDMEKIKKAKADKVNDDKDKEEKVTEEQTGDLHAEVNVYEPHMEKHAIPYPNSCLTLSSAEYGNQFINNNPDVSLNDVLKDPAEIEIQSMVEEKTIQTPHSRRKTKVILNKSKKPKAQVDSDDILKRLTRLEKKNIFLKDVPDFDKIKQEKAAKQSMLKYSTKPFDESSLKEYDQKDKLIKLLMKSKSYNTHPAHMKLYDALMHSLRVDEHDMDKQLDDQPSQMKRRHDDQDPSVDADKEIKKRKRKDSDASSSKKSKDNKESSHGTKALSRPSPNQKAVDDDELIQDGAMDDTEMA